MQPFDRLELAIGKENLEKLKNSKVLVFGVGGVGGYTIEALVRSGIYNIDIVDKDTVDITNINRQIVALNSTISKSKVMVMKDRILDINKEANVNAIECFYLKENANEFDFKKYDYIIDCVDTITAKVSIIENAYKANVKVISAMGAGNKINPSLLRVSDIYDTKVDPLAKVMRHEMKKRGIKKLKVVYSIEKPIEIDKKINEESNKPIPSSLIFVPASMGLLIASEVVKDITGIKDIKGA